MIGTLMAVAVLGLGSCQYVPLFPRMFPIPTGQNGMEEYVRAFDLYKTRFLRGGYVRYDATPEENLGLRIRAARETDSLMNLIRDGNAKPFQRMVGPSLGYGSSVGHNQVGKMLWRRADGLMALGQTNKAFEDLMAILVYGRRISGSDEVLSYIYGTFVVSDSFRGIHDHRDKIPLAIADQIVSLAEDLLLSRPLPGALERDVANNAELLEVEIADDDGFRVFISELLGEGKEVGVNVTTVRAEFESWRRLYNDHAQSALSGTEQSWYRDMKQVISGDIEKMPVGQALAYYMADLFPLLAQREARTLTQLRLLKIYGLLAKHRWIHGAYPLSLGELGESQAVLDPFTGFEFNYQNLGDSFDLFSSSFPEYGEVRVKSSRTGRFELDRYRPD